MTDILVHVEDPGAANMVIGLPKVVGDLGYECKIYASCHAKDHLTKAGQSYKEVTTSSSEILDLEKPKLILVGTSEDKESFSISLTRSAKEKNILSVAVVDMACNASLRFRGTGDDSLKYVTDFLIVPDELTANSYREIGLPDDRINVIGHPIYERAYKYRQNISPHKTQKKQREKKILFIAEGVDQLDAHQSYVSKNYTLQGRGGSGWRTAIVLEEILDAISFNSNLIADVIVRRHPKMSPLSLNIYSSEVTFDSGPAYDSINNADAVVGMTSILLVEAAIIGRPVLSVLPSPDEKEWLAPIKADVIKSVTSRSDLPEALMGLFDGKCQVDCRNFKIKNSTLNMANYILSKFKK